MLDLATIKTELQPYTAKSDLRGAWVVFCQWTVTVGVFVVMALWPNPITLIVGTILLGGRQLGFFVLTHEAGHRTLFKTQFMNEMTVCIKSKYVHP